MGNRERDEKMNRDGRKEKGEGKRKGNAFAEIENKTGEGSHRKREGRGMREGKKWKLEAKE